MICSHLLHHTGTKAMDALGAQFEALSSEAHFTKTLIKVSPLNSGDPSHCSGSKDSRKKSASYETNSIIKH